MKILLLIGYLLLSFNGLCQVNDVIKQTLMQFPSNTEFAVALIDNDEVTYVGLKKIKKKVKPIENSSSIFEIGSITKTYTSTLAFLLDKEGVIHLKDVVNNENELNFANNTPISYINLLNHTSGLPRLPTNLMKAPNFQFLNPYATYGENELMEFSGSDFELEEEPGKKSSYSNLGMGLVGYLLEKKTSKSFEELLQTYLFSELDMHHSSSARNSLKANLVQGLNAEGLPTPGWDFQVFAGCGGILSCVEDQIKFIRYQWSDSTLNELHQETIRINDQISVALGWHILNDKNWIWHNGRTYGFSSCMAIDKSAKKGVVVLSNVSAFHSSNAEIDKLTFQLLKLMD